MPNFLKKGKKYWYIYTDANLVLSKIDHFSIGYCPYMNKIDQQI